MSRAEYASCVGAGLKGKTLTRDERRMEFCILSKLCSHKSKDREAAKLICSQPKAPKPLKEHHHRDKEKSCDKEVLELTQCIVENIDMNQASNINSIGTAIANAMLRCKCPE